MPKARLLRRDDGVLFTHTPALAERKDMREVRDEDERPRTMEVDSVLAEIQTAGTKAEIKELAEKHGVDMDMRGSLASLRTKLAAFVEGGAGEAEQGSESDEGSEDETGSENSGE